MTHKVMFQFDRKLRLGWPAMPPRDERGLPPASILDPLIQMRKHRAQCIAEPPNGYGSIVCPKGGVVDRQFMISATFSARPCDSADPTQAAWWNSLGRETQATFPVEISLECTKAFVLSAPKQSFDFGKLRRVVAAEFFVLPVLPGAHSIRVLLKYAGDLEYTFTWLLKIRPKWVDLLQKIAIVLGI